MFTIFEGVPIDPNQLVANLIASFPSLVVIITGVVTSLKTLKTNVNQFPQQLSTFKVDVKNDYKALEGKVVQIIDSKLTMVVEKTVDKLDSFDKKLNGFVDKYEAKMDRLVTDTTKLVKENQTYQRVISMLVTGDTSQVKAEIISLVAKELNISEDSLKRLPSDILATLPQFKQDLMDYRRVLGELSFEKIMRELGYEKRED